MYFDPVAINAAFAIEEKRSGFISNKIDNGEEVFPEFGWNGGMVGALLETVIKMPTGKSLSIRVISWLNRFSIDPMLVVARN
jgi:hypothetical protein